MIRAFARFAVPVLLALFIARPAAAQDWRLMDADSIAAGRYVVLTLPMDTPEALTAVATELTQDFGLPLAAEWPLNSIAVHCIVFDARNSGDMDALLAALRADRRVRTAQRVQGFTVMQDGTVTPGGLLPLQWALHRMNVIAAQGISLGEGVRVGIVDTAIDRSHPDLARRVVDARDFVAVTPAPLAEDHGTAVAGVIGADAVDTGLTGIAPMASLVGLRACWEIPDGGACNSFSLARAINFAMLNDIDVLNLSLGGPEDPLLTELIEAAAEQGIVIVGAAGDGDETVFPASLPGVVAAGRAGPGRVPAPMTDILTTAPGSAHRYVSGSSIATAQVSGVVALMLAAQPGLHVPDVKSHLMAAIDAAAQGPVLDAYRAVICATKGREE